MILSGKFTKRNGLEITRVLFNTQLPLFAQGDTSTYPKIEKKSLGLLYSK